MQTIKPRIVMKYIDADKLIAEIERRIQRCEDCERDGYPDTTSSEATLKSLRSFITSLQQEQPKGGCLEKPNNLLREQTDVDFEKEEFVGVAESPLKTFPRVNDFECGGSYRH